MLAWDALLMRQKENGGGYEFLDKNRAGLSEHYLEIEVDEERWLPSGEKFKYAIVHLYKDHPQLFGQVGRTEFYASERIRDELIKPHGSPLCSIATSARHDLTEFLNEQLEAGEITHRERENQKFAVSMEHRTLVKGIKVSFLDKLGNLCYFEIEILIDPMGRIHQADSKNYEPHEWGETMAEYENIREVSVNLSPYICEREFEYMKEGRCYRPELKREWEGFTDSLLELFLRSERRILDFVKIVEQSKYSETRYPAESSGVFSPKDYVNRGHRFSQSVQGLKEIGVITLPIEEDLEFPEKKYWDVFKVKKEMSIELEDWLEPICKKMPFTSKECAKNKVRESVDEKRHSR